MVEKEGQKQIPIYFFLETRMIAITPNSETPI